ncbi:lipid A export permease/ATP-binding protein MsbA [Tepidiphilus margaritifer]|uniref:lipid A export permease/ATP-binding protein MsbA n=1 Tax=Tepidiphilus margaritifer TaxID=203471 RepID=UPI000429979B|nr:lipid A export permease/ATP-binding protein MsbA [Tepidiphilus margaritifer]
MERGMDSSWVLYRRLWQYVRPYRAAFVLAMIGYAIFASGQPMMMGALKYFVDGLTNPARAWLNLPLVGEIDTLYLVPAALMLVALWQGIGSFLGAYSLSKVSVGIIHDLRAALFAHGLRLPTAYYDSQDSGRIISRLTFDVTMTTGAVTDAIRVVVREGLTVVSLFSYLLWSNWKLTLMLAVLLPVLGAMMRSAGRKLRSASRRLQETMGRITAIATEAVLAQRVIKAFGGEQRELQRFARANDEDFQRQLRLARIGARNGSTTQLVTFVAIGSLLWLVLWLRGDATAGDLVSYVTAAGLLPKPIRQLTEVNARIARGLAGAESIFSLLDVPPERDEGSFALERARGEIVYEGVRFRYPNARDWALDGLDLHIEPGSVVALVGPSGSGKSTMAQLLLRFYDPTEGCIRLDGVPLPQWRLAALRRQIAYVGQQVVLFDATVAENIAYGAGERQVSREEIVAAARAAHALEFIERLPQGFDTPIGENGALLSGGQRQRLAIARALLKDAPVLVLDEATSALDNESERAVQAALETLMRGRTTLVIAHRLTTVERADRIVVMERGRIVESGTHAQLLAAGGRYAQLYREDLVT